jgi:hypothetical protein
MKQKCNGGEGNKTLSSGWMMFNLDKDYKHSKKQKKLSSTT